MTRPIGGAYRAEQDADGTWTIRDVPIFSEVTERYTRNGKKAQLPCTREWLSKAVDRAKAAFDGSSYLAPLHVNHFGDSEKVERAGFFLPTRVGEATVDGQRLPTVFADLLKIPAAVYAKIKDLTLPYRSAETRLTGAPEIQSLALLSKPPHFKYPLLTVGEERANPALCFSVEPHSKARLLARFEDDDVPDEKPPKDDDGGEKKPSVSGDENDKKPEGEEPSEMDELEGADPMSAQILQALQSIDAKLTALTGGATAVAGMVPGAAAGAGTPMGAKVAGFEASPDVAKALAERDGRITALEGQVEQFKADASARDAKAKALKRLAKFALPGNVEEQIDAKIKSGGPVALDAFCDGVEKFGTPLPDAEWTAGEGGGKAAPKTDDPDLADFAAKGAEVFSIATDAAARYDALPDRHPFKHDRKSWIAHSVTHALAPAARN